MFFRDNSNKLKSITHHVHRNPSVDAFASALRPVLRISRCLHSGNGRGMEVSILKNWRWSNDCLSGGFMLWPITGWTLSRFEMGYALPCQLFLFLQITLVSSLVKLWCCGSRGFCAQIGLINKGTNEFIEVKHSSQQIGNRSQSPLVIYLAKIHEVNLPYALM